MGWESAARCLICPHCKRGLTRVGGALKCARLHSFDIAREGYVNLLAGSRASARSRGDNRAMLLARRAFLEKGHYHPLSDALNALVERHLRLRGDGGRRASRVLDAGCGEGYYLGRLQEQLNRGPTGDAVDYLGLDIARDAAALAATRYRDAHFVVADSTADLPIADGAISTVLNIFAPRNPGELRRVLAPGGLLAVVIPTPNHLRELRAIFPLLGMEPDKRRRLIERFAGHFVLAESAAVEYAITLSGNALVDLMRMTPHRRYRSEVTAEGLRMIEGTQTRVGFDLLGFRPSG